jgi:hypothetical protein
MGTRKLLERIINERVGLATVGTISTDVDRAADDFARYAMQDENIKRALREMVARRAQEMLEELFGPTAPAPKRRKRRTTH